MLNNLFSYLTSGGDQKEKEWNQKPKDEQKSGSDKEE